MPTAARSAAPARPVWPDNNKKTKRGLSGFLDSPRCIIGSEKGKEARNMRGYFTAGGYYGLIDGEYRLFASESDYYEAVEEEEAA